MPRPSDLPVTPRRTLLTAGAAAGLTMLTAPALSARADGDLLTGDLRVDARPDDELNRLFNHYGDTGGQWVGADSTYSTRLKDGRLAWIFSDTLYGDVTNGTLSPTDSFFLNNSVIVQDGSHLTTVTGGTPDHPDGLVPMDGDAWHWFGAGQTRPNGDVQVGVLRTARFGTGPWDWGWHSTQLVTLDRATLKPKGLSPLPSSAGVQWASFYLRQGGHTLVYGVEDLGASKYLHVARVLGGDLRAVDRWRYWTGSAWSTKESDSTRVLVGVSNEYSVTPYAGGYLLITQDTNEIFSRRILAYRSASPLGPFTDPVEVYQMPEVGAFGSYGDANIFAYNPHEHPELRRGDEFVISYNVNSFDSSMLYDDVTIYRPRFIRARLSLH